MTTASSSPARNAAVSRLSRRAAAARPAGLTSTLQRRLRASLICAGILSCGLIAASPGVAAAATVLPVAYVEGSGTTATFNVGALDAAYKPSECPGYHAGFAVINATLSVQSVYYYGGVVNIAPFAGHVFCIGGTADDYLIDYDLLPLPTRFPGPPPRQLVVHVP